MFLNGVLNLELTAPKLEYTVNKADEGAIPVIIVAAGSSSRMGGINKLTCFGRAGACAYLGGF